MKESVDRDYGKAIVALRIFLILCVAVIGFFGIISLIKALTKPTIVILDVAPGDATIAIDGKDYRNGSYEDFEPGTYSATIKRSGFSEKNISFEVKKHESVTVLGFIVNEQTGFSYFEKSQHDIDVLRKVEDSDAKKFLAQYDEKLSIKDHLPILTNHYNTSRARLYTGEITDGTQDSRCDYAFCLKVNDTKDNIEDYVYEVIKLAGYNAADYRILYDNI